MAPGKKGQRNKFGRNGRKKDFGSRARGGKGKKGAWKPGQGNKPGQGQGQGPGQGQGTGDGPDLMGESTKKSGNTVDESILLSTTTLRLGRPGID